MRPGVSGRSGSARASRSAAARMLALVKTLQEQKIMGREMALGTWMRNGGRLSRSRQ